MDDNELALVEPSKRRGRGPSKPKTKPTQPFNVEFDSQGHAIGKHKNDWATYVGSMTRLRISILEDDWGKIEDDQKDALWEVIKEYFDLTDNDHKVSTLKQCNFAWKSFKTKLRDKFMIPNKKPYENKKYSFIEPENWDKFCRKHRSADKMKKRAIGKAYAKLQKNYAHLGRSGYRGMEVDLSKVNMDEELKKEIMDITCEHTKRWILARITCPDMEEIFRELVDVDKKMVQGLIPKEKRADPLIVVLGPEHGGRTRTVGNGIGFRKGIVGYKQTKKRAKSTEEIEAIVDRKLAQRDAERDAERDAARDAARDAERDAARDAARDAELVAEGDMEREASNEGRLQRRRKQSSCESTTVVHQDKEKLKDIKEPKSCVLFSPYTEDMTPIARGMVYPIGDGTIHGGPLIPYYMKVSIDSFVPAFGDTKLPVLSKSDTITVLKQSVGSFLQWPRCRISRILENTPTSKDKASQRKEAATLQPTLATPNQVAQETMPLLPTLQTPALLETQQTQVSSAVEDARKAKEK